jgi:hypothetical protein
LLSFVCNIVYTNSVLGREQMFALSDDQTFQCHNCSHVLCNSDAVEGPEGCSNKILNRNKDTGEFSSHEAR